MQPVIWHYLNVARYNHVVIGQLPLKTSPHKQLYTERVHRCSKYIIMLSYLGMKFVVSMHTMANKQSKIKC